MRSLRGDAKTNEPLRKTITRINYLVIIQVYSKHKALKYLQKEK